jgi:hypothetical protein
VFHVQIVDKIILDIQDVEKSMFSENRLMNHFYENHSKNSSVHKLNHCNGELCKNNHIVVEHRSTDYFLTLFHTFQTIDKYEPDFNEILE